MLIILSQGKTLFLAGVLGFVLVATPQSRGGFRLCYTPRSVAALTRHRRLIHYRSHSNPLYYIRQTKKSPDDDFFVCIWATKKIFFVGCNKDSNSCAISRRRRVYHQGVSLVYHQHEVLYIIKPQENARWRVMRYKVSEQG